MERSLLVLHIEDNLSDAELIAATLESDGLHCQIERVETRDEVVVALASQRFDVILCDCTLPSFNGFSALELARKYCPETPFIFVSGWLDEEAAIDMLKSGATDYVLKQRMSRLCPAVRRALNEATEKQKHRHAEERLQSHQRFMQQITDSSPNILYLYDVTTQRMVYVNRSVSQITGYSIEAVQALGSLFAPTLLHPDEVEKVRYQVNQLTRIQEGEIREIEFRFRCANQHWHWLHSSNTLFARSPEGQPHLILGTAQDVTEDKHLKEQLHHAQKMESIGTLAGGVAHDFNNLLTAIIGNAQLALASLSEHDPVRARILEIEKAGKRASDLTRQLLVFSRRQRIDRQPLNLNDTISHFLKMLRRIIGEDIALQFLADSRVPAVLADAGQIEQVIMNLAVNARDAMTGGGTFLIETHRVTLDEAYCRNHPMAAPGCFAQVVVSDTGSGMSAEMQQHIFEPFFTTKEAGKGTGLGLSMVYGIVKQHEGFIEVYSEVGQGTTFKIYLPLSEEGVTETLCEAQPQPRLLKGTETILVVEDEENLRQLATDILSGLGYQVLTANDGLQAMEIFAAHQEHLDLMLLDVIMPQMGGQAVYQQIREAGSHLPILFMTGYNAEMLPSDFMDDQSAMMIQKPYSVFSLGQKVREALEARRAY